jgi:hypothetical protein
MIFFFCLFYGEGDDSHGEFWNVRETMAPFCGVYGFSVHLHSNKELFSPQNKLSLRHEIQDIQIILKSKESDKRLIYSSLIS